MAKRIIVWTKEAANQRRSILKYWTQRNKSTFYAEKIITISERIIKLFAKYPESNKEADHPNTRVAVMGYFSIYYKYTSDKIYITAFWDNRQDPKKLIKILKRQDGT